MNNVQIYNPSAPVSRFSSNVRFRPYTAQDLTIDKADKSVSTHTQPRPPSGVPDIQKLMASVQGDHPTFSRQESAVVHLGVDRPGDALAISTVTPDGRDGHGDGGRASLDESDNNTDDGRSFDSLFSPCEPDTDWIDTDTSPESALECLDGHIRDGPLGSVTPNAGDRQDQPTVLENNGSTMDMCAISRSPERERWRGFDSRAANSLSNPEKSGRVESSDENEDVVDEVMNDQYPPSIRHGESTLPSSHAAEDGVDMEPKDQAGTRSRSPNGGDVLNERGDGTDYAADQENQLDADVSTGGEHNRPISNKRQRSDRPCGDTIIEQRTKRPVSLFRSSASTTSSSDDESDRKHHRPSEMKRAPIPSSLNWKDRSPSKPQQINVAERLNSKDSPRSPEDGQDRTQMEKVYEYDGLVDHRFNNGKEEVRVLWPEQYTWEPASEFPKSMVDKVKKRQARVNATSGPMRGNQKGRRKKLVDGKASRNPRRPSSRTASSR